ncbi:hypothetical protein MTO96_043935 [Rhipicephalus appendiculatus]
MAFWEYTLTGYGDFWEQRRVAFEEPVPANRVCGICGRALRVVVLLACRHVLCVNCKDEVCEAKQCPFDGTAVTKKELLWITLDNFDLDKLRVVCVVGGRKCPDFCGGTLWDLKDHLPRCRRNEVRCTKCRRSIAREAVVEHYRQCCDRNPAGRVQKVVEEIRAIKEDLESLRQRALDERDGDHDLVNGVNGLVERLASLDRALCEDEKVVEEV